MMKTVRSFSPVFVVEWNSWCITEKCQVEKKVYSGRIILEHFLIETIVWYLKISYAFPSFYLF